MRRKLKWGKTVLAIALAGAMSVTSVNLPSFSVFAAEQNEQGAQTRSETKITNLAFPTNEVDISSQGAYAIAFDSLIVNGEDKVLGSSLQSSERLKWYIDPKADGNFVELGHEGSGLTWGTNYGWDGAQPNGGFWFNPIKNTVIIKVELADNPSVHAEIKLVIDDSVSEKGAEYDFTKDNSAYDYADPGKNKAGYDLVWSDEFDGNYGNAKVDANTGLNLDNWSYQLGDGTEVGNPGWGNSEKQSYTSNNKNIAVNEDLNGDGHGDGMLRLTASYEENGYKNGSETEKDYTSARIRTTSRTNKALFTTTYGYIESRMALPATKGAWPAFWMLGVDQKGCFHRAQISMETGQYPEKLISWKLVARLKKGATTRHVEHFIGVRLSMCTKEADMLI